MPANNFEDTAIDVREFGYLGDGEADDSDAIEKAFAEMASLGPPPDRNTGTKAGTVLRFPPNSTAKVTRPIHAQVSQEATIMAYGVKFVAHHDGLLFQLNPSASSLDTSMTVVRDVRWLGGHFFNNNPDKTGSIAIQAQNFRGLVIRDFVIERFWTAIEFARLDTYKFADGRIVKCNHGIRHPAGLVSQTAESVQVIEIQNVHFSLNSPAVTAICIEEKVNDLFVRECSFNGATEQGSIRIDDGLNSDTRNVHIIGNHLEQGNSDAPYIDLRSSAGIGYRGVRIEANQMASGNPGWRAGRFANVQGLRIVGNVLTDGSGGSSEQGWEIDSACTDIAAWGNQYSNFNPETRFVGSFKRAEITALPEIRPSGAVLTGWIANEISSGTLTLDMASIFPDFPPDLVPKGYWLQVEARDSGSVSMAPQVRLKESATSSDAGSLALRLHGVKNKQVRSTAGYVRADADGNIHLAAEATGNKTLKVTLGVQAFHM